MRMSICVPVLGLGIALAATPAPAQDGVRAGRAQLQDAWLSSDVAVVGIYKGKHPTHGEPYHVVSVTDVWMGTLGTGDLVFKAPRTVRADSSDEVVLFLWDRLAGVTDSFIEASRQRHGDTFVTQIGPDSLSTHLLPFSRYAFPFKNGKLVLQGTSIHKDELSKREARNLLLDYELTLLPEALYDGADAVVRGRITRKDIKTKTVEGVAVEYVVTVDCKRLETLKGEVPDPLQLTYSSFPRSPRFDTNDEVILFLRRGETGLYLHDGKRSVLYVMDGKVAATGAPVQEFTRSLRARKSNKPGQ